MSGRIGHSPLQMSKNAANIALMTKAVKLVGRTLLRDFGELRQLQRSSTGATEYAGRALIKAENTMKENLVDARPNYGWSSMMLGDESGRDPTRRWVASAICGIHNFNHGLPYWAISIALENKGKIVAAVIYDAFANEVFHCEEGGGSWLNGSRVRVSGRKKLEEMLVGTELSGKDGPIESSFNDVSRITPKVKGVRMLGATGLDLANLAVGRIDGYWSRTPNEFEAGAGALILSSAGGITEAIDLNSDLFGESGIVAAGGEAFDAIAKLVRN